MIKTSKRNSYLDVVKGLAIFLVILGHCIQYGTDYAFDHRYVLSSFYQCIYSFHMPLFMLLSGYFFFYSTKKLSHWENVKSKVQHLVIPALSGGVISFLLSLPNYTASVDVATLAGDMIESMLFGVWFLWAVFFSSCLVLFLHKFFNDNLLIYICVMCVLLLFPNDNNISLYVYMFPYYVLGYLLNKYNISEYVLHMKSYVKVIVGLLSLLLYSFLFTHYTHTDLIYVTGTSIFKWSYPYIVLGQLSTDIYRYVIGIVGACMVLFVVKLLIRIFAGQNYIYRILIAMGKKTLGLYVFSSFFHSILLDVYTKYFQQYHWGYFSAIVEAILLSAITYYMLLLVEKNKITNKLFLGR